MTSIACPPDESTAGFPSAPASSTMDHGQLTMDRAARNRANAAKSTGPRTAGGKARSARNARTHGLTSSTPPTDLPVPDPTAQLEFTTTLQELTEEHRPVTPTQHLLVRELALVSWKLQYVPRVEHRLLNTPLDLDAPEPDPAHVTPHPRLDHPADPTARVLAAHFAQGRPTPLTRLLNYHHRLQARVSSLLNQLRRLRRDQQNQHDDDTGETWRRAYDRRNNTPAAREPLEAELRRIHHDNRRKAEQARHAHDLDDPPEPANTCQSAPNPANARQTTPSHTPAQNEPTPANRSTSDACVVAPPPNPPSPTPACNPVQPDATPDAPAQNEPTTDQGQRTKDTPDNPQPTL
jgi:hypothetical protein